MDIFFQFLIYLGLNEEKINSILDNSNEKNGLRLYGSDLIVREPNKLEQFNDPVVIVFAGQYQQEIEQQIININSNCYIINPLIFRIYKILGIGNNQ